MNVIFYPNFTKKVNSTYRPAPNYQGSITLDCKLLDNVSIVSPVLLLEQPSNVDITMYNYCYIDAFGRYYFINNIVHTGSLYKIYLAGDVLASFRTPILNSTQYVIRSSSTSDENIVDTMYLTKPFSSLTTRTAVSSYNTGYVYRTYKSGGEEIREQVFYFNYGNRVGDAAVCFGLIGANGVGANYYVCTESEFIDFMGRVVAYIPSDMGSLADGVKKSLLGLSDYIVSVVRLPVMPNTNNLATHKTSVKLGSYSINCDCYTFIPGADYEEYELVNSISLPQHPNANVHSYYKMSPYTSYVLDFLPLGSIPLDATKIYGATSIGIKWRIDYITGQAWFIVGAKVSTNTYLTLFTDIAQVGIPIPLSQLKVDSQTGIGLSLANAVNNYLKKSDTYIPKTNGSGETYTGTNSRNFFVQFGSNLWQGTKDLLRPVGKAIGDMLGSSDTIIGNFLDKNTNVFDQVIDYAGNILGDMVTKGSTGSYLTLVAGVPSVRAFFVDQTENDNARFGSPLYKKVQLSTLSGFCVCKNATINISNTNVNQHPPVLSETQAIVSLLNSGVYLEV